MKNYPQSIQEWTDESYQAMTTAWDELTRFSPFPSESQKEKLIETAVLSALENRDITDTTFITHAKEFAQEEFMIDYESRDLVAKVDFSLCFLLAYFDAHLSLSLVTQEIADDAIANLRSNYNLSYSGKTQNNVLSVNYSLKS